LRAEVEKTNRKDEDKVEDDRNTAERSTLGQGSGSSDRVARFLDLVGAERADEIRTTIHLRG